MDIQLTNIKYEINKKEISYDEKIIDIVSEMRGYTITCTLFKSMNAIMEISTCKELTIAEIKEEIERQLTERR